MVFHLFFRGTGCVGFLISRVHLVGIFFLFSISVIFFFFDGGRNKKLESFSKDYLVILLEMNVRRTKKKKIFIQSLGIVKTIKTNQKVPNSRKKI